MDKLMLQVKLMASLSEARDAEKSLPRDPCYRAAYDLGYTAAAQVLAELLKNNESSGAAVN